MKWEENVKGPILLSLGCKPFQWGSCSASEMLAGSSPKLSKSMCKALKRHCFKLFSSRVAMCCVIVFQPLMQVYITREKLPAALEGEYLGLQCVRQNKHPLFPIKTCQSI